MRLDGSLYVPERSQIILYNIFYFIILPLYFVFVCNTLVALDVTVDHTYKIYSYTYVQVCTSVQVSVSNICSQAAIRRASIYTSVFVCCVGVGCFSFYLAYLSSPNKQLIHLDIPT